MPAAVHNLGAILFTFLEYHHRLVLGNVDGVYISTGLDAEARTGGPGRQVSHGGYINVFSRVKLECWLGRMDFEVDLGLRVVERGQLLHGQRARVKRYTAGVRVDNKAVINVGLLIAKREGLVGSNAGVVLDGPCRYASLVDDLVLVGDEGDFCAGDARTFGQVEVASHGFSGVTRMRGACTCLPMVGHVDGSLTDLVANKFSLILDMQDLLLGAVDLLLLLDVPHAYLYGARVTLVAVFAEILEQGGLLAIAVKHLRAFKLALSPTHVSTMQRVGPVVQWQLVRLPI